MRKFNDIRTYIVNLTELIWNFIRHPEAYPKNALLAVQPDLMETVIDNPNECKYCDFYNLNLLVERDNQGNMVPNNGAIAQLARRYY